MGISLRAASSGGNSNAVSTVTPTLPTGWQAGDLLLFVCTWNASQTITFSQTSGTGTWTLYSTGDGNSGTGALFTTMAARRVMASGDTAPTFTASASEGMEWVCIGLTPDPGYVLSLDTFATSDPDKSTTAATAFATHAATAAGPAEASVILTGGRRSTSGAVTVTYTPPSGWTLPTNGDDLYGGGSSVHGALAAVAYQLGVGPGSVAPGNETVTDTGSGSWCVNTYHALVTETALAILPEQLAGRRLAPQPGRPAGALIGR